MQKTRLSSKGQVIIPKSTREAHHWQSGQELVVIDTEDGVLLKPVKPAPPATLDELAGCLSYAGLAKSPGEMELAIGQGVRQFKKESC